MALFKIYKGLAENLNNSTWNEGYCYYTTDDSKFYVDSYTKETSLTRVPDRQYFTYSNKQYTAVTPATPVDQAWVQSDLDAEGDLKFYYKGRICLNAHEADIADYAVRAYFDEDGNSVRKVICTETSLSSYPIIAGTLYFTLDTRSIYIDIDDTNRIQMLDNGGSGGSADVSKCYQTNVDDVAGRWNVTIPEITELYDGLTIRIYLTTSHDTVQNPGWFNTLNVNGLGEQLVWFKSNQALQNEYGLYDILDLTYFENGPGAFNLLNNYYDISGFPNKGTWTPNVNYSSDDVVTYNGKLYRYNSEEANGSTFVKANWLEVYQPYTTLGTAQENAGPINGGWIVESPFVSVQDKDYNHRSLNAIYQNGNNSNITPFKLCVKDRNGKIQPLLLEDSIYFNKTCTSVAFVPDKIYYYANDVLCPMGQNIPKGTLYQAYEITQPELTFNADMINGSDIYLKGLVDTESGLFQLDSRDYTGWCMQYPSENNKLEKGYYYLYVGRAGDGSFHLDINNPLYYYDGTNLIKKIDEADKISHSLAFTNGENNIPLQVVDSSLTAESFDGSQDLELVLNYETLGAAPANTGTYTVEGGGNDPGDWTGSCSEITTPYDGLTISYIIGVEGNSDGTRRNVNGTIDVYGERDYTALNFNNTGFKPIYFNKTNEKRLTTEYHIGDRIELVYHEVIAQDSSVGLHEDLSWWHCLADYDTNDPNYRTGDLNFSPYAGSTNVFPHTLCVLDEANLLHSLVDDLQTGTTTLHKDFTKASFKPNQIYYYNGEDIISRGSPVPSGTLYSHWGDFNLCNSTFNTELDAHANIYLKGHYSVDNGLFTISSGLDNNYHSWYVQAPMYLDNSAGNEFKLIDYFEPNLYYLLLCGTGENADNANLFSTHEIYYCESYFDEELNNNNIRLLPVTVAAQRLTVSAGGVIVENTESHEYPVYFKDGVPTPTSHYVNANVPTNALFTDTRNTAGITGNTTTNLYLVGSQTQGNASGKNYDQTYANTNLYVNNGNLYANTMNVTSRDSGGLLKGSVQLKYDSDHECLDFIFS